MFDLIAVDIHSHILPGLDDGVTNITETIEICKKMLQLGYKKMIVTPHNIDGLFYNPKEKVYEELNKVKVALFNNNINIQLSAASEYYLNNKFIDSIKKKDVLTFGKKYVLFELSPFILHETLWEDIQVIIDNGYIPVLAHPERYVYFHNNKEKYHQLHEMGVKLQLNLVSLSQEVSKELRSIAEYLIDNKLVSFCGSDTHSIKNTMIISTLPCSTRYLEKLIKTNNLLNSSLL